MEKWKSISGADAHYQISDQGRVRNSKTGRILKLKNTTIREGKYTVVRCNLRSNKRSITKHVARMVLEAFNPINDSENYHADHIDHDPTNNHLSNLRWLTPKQNNLNRRDHEFYETEILKRDMIIMLLLSINNSNHV